MTTQLLQRAVDLASSLTTEEQDGIAHIILAELEDESRWSDAFSGSATTLAAMADRALQEHNAGATESADDLLV